jgi:hypothetical protein
MVKRKTLFLKSRSSLLYTAKSHAPLFLANLLACPSVRLLVFVKTDSALVSEQSVPAGKNFPVIVQIKANPESKTLVEKFTLDLSTCSGCGLAEYACTCAEGH